MVRASRGELIYADFTPPDDRRCRRYIGTMAPDYDGALRDCIRDLRSLAADAERQAERLTQIADDLEEARRRLDTDVLPKHARDELAARNTLADHKQQHALGIWYRWCSRAQGAVDVAWATVLRAWVRR